MLGWISVARCLSQHDLAYEAGVSRSYLCQLEKGSFYASSEVKPAELLKLPPRTSRLVVTQEQLAEISGFSQQYISGLEQGRRNPTVVTLYELATALGVRSRPSFD